MSDIRPLAACLLLLASQAAFGQFAQVDSTSDGFTSGGRPLSPWGFNYAPRNEMIEDHWDMHWSEIEADFQELHDLGANVARVHLQYNRIMKFADEPNTASLQKVRDILALGERTGVAIDLTGLGCYKPADTPEWYKAMNEPERWRAQARFWEVVAETCTSSPALFCYDLINEPVSPGEKRKPGEWASGTLFGGFDFVQFIALDPKGRRREDIATSWIQTMTRAIRMHDTHHLITVGMLPFTEKSGWLYGFVPERVAPELDFLSIHIYPETGKLDFAFEGLKRTVVGKPVIIEEIFPLSCSVPDLEIFMRRSRGVAHGWIGHYFGEPPLKLSSKGDETTISDVLMLEQLKLFEKLKPELTGTNF